MEFLFEFLLELALEGSIEVSKCRKIPKFIRYPLIAVLALFCLAVIGLVFVAGVLVLKENVLVGIFLISIGLFLLIMSGITFRKVYLTRTNKEQS